MNMRTRWLAAFVMLLVALLGLFVGPTAFAHEDSNPSPNGLSPWHWSESWAITGSWYGEGCHVDHAPTSDCPYSGHFNDYYALDFAIPGDGCWKRVYPVWDVMTVAGRNDSNGMLDMRKTINGVQYRLRYYHLYNIRVTVGATIGTSTIVGYSGDTGLALGCHLHMGIHRLGSDGWWHSIPPMFCGRTYPRDHVTRFPGC
jgi:murein DD-endopeptidase MepM/ murein hydrolase activator NlpD